LLSIMFCTFAIRFVLLLFVLLLSYSFCWSATRVLLSYSLSCSTRKRI